MKNVTEAHGPAKAKKPLWIRSFYVLAAFNVLTVIAALHFSHMLIEQDAISVRGNQKWVKRISGIVQLTRLASGVNAPASLLFLTRDSRSAATKQRDAERKFASATTAIRQDLVSQLKPEKAELLLVHLDETTAACDAMSANASAVYSLFDKGQFELAAAQIAKVNADYARFSNALTDLRNEAREMQMDEFNQQQAYEAVLEKGQYVLAGLVVLMVLGATLYGRKATDQSEHLLREQTKYIQDLKQAEDHIRTSFDQAVVGMSVAALDGRWLKVNSALVNIVGYSESELLATDFHSITHPDDRSRDQEMVKKMLANDAQTCEIEKRFIHKNGKTVVALLSATLVRDENNQPLHFIAQIQDITVRKQMEIDCKNALQTAESASRAKSEFLANMSHELRTPLSGVIGMTELLINSKLSKGQLEYALMVRRSAESLLTILNDILDLSKIEAGKLTLESIPFNLQNVIEEVAVLMSARASEKNLELIIHYSQETPSNLIGDPIRIRQMLSNIVGNAVKFTNSGHVLIEAQCNSRLNGKASLMLRVEDTGIGIDESQSTKLFQKFTQADSSTTRRFGGTGLGLAICKSIVEAMQGTIELSSVAGKGSVFTMTLVLPEAVEAEAPIRPAAQEGLQNLRFLIVDDNRINRFVLSEQFSGWRLHSVAVESAKDALSELHAAVARGEPYDVALLDYQMPEMDGGMLAKAIKSEQAIRNTMLVMLTSMGQHFTAEKMKETGLAALLHKPVRQSVLLQTLDKVWAIYTGKAPAGKSSAQLLNAVKAIAPAALNTMNVLLVEDNEVNREVAIGMLDTLGCHFEVAIDGIEGLNRVIRETFDAVLMDCHMPMMDGYQATAEIRKIEKASASRTHVPIIAMTANAMKGDREQCIAAGMDDYLSKPISLSVLAAMLSKYAPNSNKSATLSHQSASAVKAPESKNPVFDYNAALDTASGKPERLKRIVCAFMADAPKRITALTNALLSGNKLVAEREAHSLKGAAANLAAERFRSHAFDAECACKSGDLPVAEKMVPLLSADFNDLLKELKPLAC